MSDNNETEIVRDDEEQAAEEVAERGLGRGLAALFGEDDEDEIYSYLSEDGEGEAYEDDGNMSFRMMPIEWIKPCHSQPRQHFDTEALKELSDSIAAHGIIQPISVRPMADEENAYEIIAGERRWRAAQIAQLHQVPVTIQYLTDEDMMEMALIENLQRENLTAVEEAEGYQHLMDEYGHTQEKVAASLGKSRSHVANTLRLLTLPEPVKEYINDGKLSAGHARALVGAPDAEMIAEQIISQNLNVRDVERLRAEQKGSDKKKPKKQGGEAKQGKSVDILALEKELSELLGLQVHIKTKGQGGELVIHYKNLDQMDDILHKLSHNPGRIMASG